MINESTIAAIATPIGTGGIGIIRISGPKALFIANLIFLKKNNNSHKPEVFESHKLYYGHIVDPVKNSVVDEVLLTYMKAPNSYTTEDVVEIQAHSGPFVIKSILNIIIEMMPHLILGTDKEISKRLEVALKKKGISVITKAKAENISLGKNSRLSYRHTICKEIVNIAK